MDAASPVRVFREVLRVGLDQGREPGRPRRLLTEPGMGYRFQPD